MKIFSYYLLHKTKQFLIGLTLLISTSLVDFGLTTYSLFDGNGTRARLTHPFSPGRNCLTKWKLGQHF